MLARFTREPFWHGTRLNLALAPKICGQHPPFLSCKWKNSWHEYPKTYGCRDHVGSLRWPTRVTTHYFTTHFELLSTHFKLCTRHSKFFETHLEFTTNSEIFATHSEIAHHISKYPQHIRPRTPSVGREKGNGYAPFLPSMLFCSTCGRIFASFVQILS